MARKSRDKMRQIRQSQSTVRDTQGQQQPDQAVPSSSSPSFSRSDLLLFCDCFYFAIFSAILFYGSYASDIHAFWMTSLDFSSRALKRLAGTVLPSEKTLSLLNNTLFCVAVAW